MATLVHPKVAPASTPLLNSPVPAPFPRDLLQQQHDHRDSGAIQQVQPHTESQPAGPSDADNVRSSTVHSVLVSNHLNCSKLAIDLLCFSTNLRHRLPMFRSHV